MLRALAPRALGLQASSFLRPWGQQAAFVSLPLVDVGSLADPSAGQQEKELVAEELHRACRDVGFFYVKNHGVSGPLCKKVLQQSRDWFNLPVEVKEQLLLSPATHYRGYQRMGSNVTRYEGGYQRDWHEALDYFKEADNAALQAKGLSPSPLHGPNPWPSQLPGYEATLKEYVSAVQQLGSQLLEGIALGLHLPQGFFKGERAGIDGSYWVLRIIHYPSLTDAPEFTGEGGGVDCRGREGILGAASKQEVSKEVRMSCGEHTDYGLLTLVLQEPDVTALQVKNAAGAWVDAVPVPGTFVVNIGDMLKVWSNGLYQPTPHRVVNIDPSRSRVSVPFFYEPCFEAVVEPAEQLVSGACAAEVGTGGGGRGSRFAPVRYGSHLESKVLTNFEL